MNKSRAVQKASRLSSFASLVNAIIGVGILGLPYALASTGWVLGILLLVISGVVTIFVTHILAHCADKSGYPSSLYSVVIVSFPRFALLVDIANLLDTFLTCSSFLIALGGLMPQVMLYFGVTGLFAGRVTWIAVCFLICGSLSFPRNIDALKYSSFFALIVEVFLIIIIVVSALPSVVEPCQGFTPSSLRANCIGDTKMFNTTVDVLKVLPIFVQAFGCTSNLFPILNELEAPTLKRWDSVAFASIGCTAVLYTTVACCGYFTYGSEIQSNLLLSYPNTSLLSAARLLTSLHVTFASYPLFAMAGRYSAMSLCRLLFDGSGTHQNDAEAPVAMDHDSNNVREDSSQVHPESVLLGNAVDSFSYQESQLRRSLSTSLSGNRSDNTTQYRGRFCSCLVERFHEHRESVRHYVVTALFILASLLVAIVTPDLGIILQFTGATGGSLLTFILPGLAYYILHKNSPPSVFKYLSLAMLGFGVVFTPVSLYFIFAV